MMKWEKIMIEILAREEEVCAFLLSTPKGLLEFQVCLDAVGTPVIFINTPDWEDRPITGPELRVYLNDGLIAEGTPLPFIGETIE
jgi:hypothetical protein